MKWSKEENKILQQNYSFSNMDELLKLLPNRSQSAINIHASNLNITKSRQYYNNNIIKADLSVLLDESHETYYWVGFILGDGYIYNNCRLTIILKKDDNSHLNKFKRYINYQSIYNPSDISRASVQDKVIISKFTSKFDIRPRKTYNPPNIDSITHDNSLLMSLFIGLLDADGCVKFQSGRKDIIISFRTHSSWLNFYTQIRERLFPYVAKPYILNDGYLMWNIGNYNALYIIKQHIEQYKLPVLERKFNKLLKDRRLSE